MAVVVFDPAGFREMFPDEFEPPKYTDTFLNACFSRACIQISNTESARIPLEQRGPILYLATAHLAFIGKNRDAGLSGQVSGASQGSTSISTTVAPAPFTEQWWFMTTYGQECWQACAPYRSFIWVNP